MTLALALTAGFGEVKTHAYAEERRAFDDSSVYIYPMLNAAMFNDSTRSSGKS